ncbi:hypothetical protein [Hymenobacter volaticus]|uniref:Uncharacterized protein n=1 Tax=Hymenobacter volaticus TaxID=2932254 RepID=A0ABY4GAQ8_9BACT|nr:hypothetical protein [Hymenobacter volaticus]UOQ67973.1 hypothetical protein MUN86_09005 [Hymenobacter volaticus]
MIDFSYNGIKNTFGSFSLFNISIYAKKEQIQIQDEIKPDPLKVDIKPVFTDFKTTLGGSDVTLIEGIKDNIDVYLFIERYKDHSSWNLVVPVISEQSTGRVIYQYGLGYFALEGSGGGLSKTDSMMFYLKKHKEKGFNVSIFPMVIDNEYLNNFEYVDSGTKLNDLTHNCNATELIHYRKDSFEWIYKKYKELIKKYELE